MDFLFAPDFKENNIKFTFVYNILLIKLNFALYEK